MIHFYVAHPQQSSPFYDVGIYLPGAISGPSNPSLNSGWVNTVSSQGWGIIPIWSGPQPPCTVEPHKHHFSAANAYTEGQEQAGDAYTSASTLGLDGTIIYVDIEQYSHSVCGAAVQQYISGWAQEMHALAGSGSAGVYGNQDVAALDFTAADDGYITRADNHVTIWGLNHYSQEKSGNETGLTDDLAWTNNQRIHQYEIDKWHIWGGVSLHIDSNLVDARVVPALGLNVRYPIFQAPVQINDGGIAGINNGVNISGNPKKPAPQNAGMHMGTVVGPATNYVGGGDGPGAIMSACPLGDAFVDSPLKGTTSIALPVLTSSQCAGVSGINNIGQVIGYDNDIGGFLYTPGANSSMILLPGGLWPSSINDAGWIIGVGDSGCALTKPPYTSVIPFDSIGPYSCPSGDNTNVRGFWGYGTLAINGLGQIAGTIEELTEVSIDKDGNPVYDAQTSVIVDDVESGAPGASDHLSILATTQTNCESIVSGINNNGQVAGVYSSWSTVGFLPYQGFFINTDGSVDLLTTSTGPYSSISGINDDVQLAGGSCSDANCDGWVGFTIDSQH